MAQTDVELDQLSETARTVQLDENSLQNNKMECKSITPDHLIVTYGQKRKVKKIPSTSM